MHKLYNHSKSTLFLIELILSILILSLTCTACVEIFAAAKKDRQKARELNHIQELVVSAGEVLEGWDGNISTYNELFPCSTQSKNTLQYFYDSQWQLCQKENSSYTLTIHLKTTDLVKKADLCFTDAGNTELFRTSVSFPFQSNVFQKGGTQQ